DRGQHLHHREEEGIIGDRAEVRLEVVAVDPGEAVRGRALAVEDLDDADPGDPFLEEGVDPREADTDVAERLPDPAAEVEGGQEDEGDDGEGDEGEAPVEEEERADDEEEGEDIAEDGDDPRAEE